MRNSILTSSINILLSNSLLPKITIKRIVKNGDTFQKIILLWFSFNEYSPAIEETDDAFKFRP